MKPHVVIISAASGTGKTSLCAGLKSSMSNVVESVSATTRPPRGKEEDGVDYHFLSREEFASRVELGLFLEYAEVHGNMYGTPVDSVRVQLDRGNQVILDIDVQGARNVKMVAEDALPGRNIKSVFIKPPSMQELERRLRDRALDSDEVIRRRLKNAKKEMLCEGEFDFVIVNDDFEQALSQLVALMNG